MKKSPFLLSLFLLPALLNASSDFSERMKARLREVLEAKDSGQVGEGVDGYLHLREGGGASVLQLVDSENADRRLLFADLASKTGGKLEEVARQFSIGMTSKAKPGHWFKTSAGNWVQKP